MQQHGFCQHLTVGVKKSNPNFQNIVMLHIKLNGITNAAKCKQIVCPFHTTRPLRWRQRSKHFFSEISQVAYQIRREWIIEHNESTYSVLTHTLDHWGGVKCQNIFILKVVKLHIKLNRIQYGAPCTHIFCPYTHPQPVDWIKR